MEMLGNILWFALAGVFTCGALFQGMNTGLINRPVTGDMPALTAL